MTISPLSFFDRRRTAFWATTYTFEPGLFDEFFFRRIGEPPLNANILADASRLEALWSDWQAEPWRLGRINRDYLVRPVRLPAGAFHAKTYLLAGKTSAVLLVGSGNLSINGMLEGKEVFCEFSTATSEGSAAIAAWGEWMDDLITQHGDDALRERWIHFINSASWFPKDSSGSPFIHNLQSSIHEQLITASQKPVDELHILAPFYDAECTAIARLLHDLRPSRLDLYLPHEVSVDGTRLAEILADSSSDISIHGFDRQEFVHAKLFGCISGNEAVLLSGSANCSRPALLTTADHGNAEVGVLARTTPDVVRNAFLPKDWNLVSIDQDAIREITLRRQETTSGSWPVRLQTARLERNGHVTVQFESIGSQVVDTVMIDGDPFTLSDSKTADPLDSNHSPVFAWLADSHNTQISNSVPVDHAERLAMWLQDRAQSSDQPSELYASDVETEIGEMLEALNRGFIFDIDEVLASAGRGSVGPEVEQEGEDAASAFWEAFDPETLRFDPRSHRYGHLLAGSGVLNWSPEDEITELIESMAGRFRAEESGLHGHASPPIRTEERAPASPSLQRRVGNLLLRWSKALNDQRFRWIDPAAPAVNYHLLLDALAASRAGRYVTPTRASTITLALLQSFQGYILALEEDERENVLSRLSDEDAHVAAALVYAALEPASAWREVVFEWQPSIKSAIEHGLLSAGDSTLALLDTFSRADASPQKPSSLSRIDDHLQELAVFINDAHWCRLQEEELGLSDVNIRMNQGRLARKWPYVVTVAGVTTLRVDPRIVRLVSRALAYKRTHGVIIEAAEPMEDSIRPQRLNASLEETPSIFASDKSGDYCFRGQLTKSKLRVLIEREQGFVEILVPDT